MCPGYFGSLGIPITRGRDFTAGDTTQSLPVAIISESTASLYWPNQDPLGRRLRIGDGEWMTIVGVAADVRQIRLDAVKPRMLYRSYAQAAWPSMTITVKTAGEPLVAGDGGAARREEARRRHAGVARPLHGVRDCRLHGRPPVPDAAAGPVLSRRAHARHDRRLRCRQLPGGAADPRDGHQGRARGAQERR